MRIEKLTEASLITDKDMSTKILNGRNDEIKQFFTDNPDQIGNKYRLDYDQDLVMFAIYADNKEIFDWFLANGARALADKKGFTPLHQAAVNPDPHYVRELVKFGLKINRSNKKTPSALAFAGEFITKLSDGLGGQAKKQSKVEKASELMDTFKELIKQGADSNTLDSDGDELFVQLVKSGIVPFVKIMVDADKSVLKQKLGRFSPLDLALNNFDDDLVDYFLDSSDDFEIEFIDAKRYITATADTDRAMKVYDLFGDSAKEMLDIQTMMYVQNGKEKMLNLFNRGVVIGEGFLKDARIREIADELMATDRKEELIELGAKFNVEEFLSQEVKDIFLF